jgi:hypothetical protein
VILNNSSDGNPFRRLELAQRIALNQSNTVESLMVWAKDRIERLEICLDSDEYGELIGAADSLSDCDDRRQYLRYIFLLCLDGGKHREIDRIAIRN